MAPLKRMFPFLEEANQQVNPEHRDICNIFEGLLQEINALAGNQPECQAQAVRAIELSRSLEVSISGLLREKQGLEETKKRMQLALSREQTDNEQLLRRVFDQDVIISCFQTAFPALQAGIRDLRGSWENIATPDSSLGDL